MDHKHTHTGLKQVNEALGLTSLQIICLRSVSVCQLLQIFTDLSQPLL